MASREPFADTACAHEKSQSSHSLFDEVGAACVRTAQSCPPVARFEGVANSAYREAHDAKTLCRGMLLTLDKCAWHGYDVKPMAEGIASVSGCLRGLHTKS